MRAGDLDAVLRIAAAVHPGLPEEPEVFAERLRLWPAGCFVLGEAPLGYVISHPWFYGEPPALNTRLGVLPAAPSTFYIHDLAILPEARGGGHAASIVTRLITHARDLPSLSLIAVSNSAPFWERHGFRAVDDHALRAKLASYGADARFMVRASTP
jgi:ribosomal protein S18 acetylase RimI-like enzyme